MGLRKRCASRRAPTPPWAAMTISPRLVSCSTIPWIQPTIRALRVDCSLPAEHTGLGLGKEAVRHRLELLGRQVAGRGAIVLVQGCHHAEGYSLPLGEDARSIHRFTFAAAVDGRHARQHWAGGKPHHAVRAQLRQRPVRHRDRGVDRDLRVGQEHDIGGGCRCEHGGLVRGTGRASPRLRVLDRTH